MLIPAVDSYADFLALAAMPIGVLTFARAFWKSSTRTVRERTAVLLEAVRDAVGKQGDGGGTDEDGR
jgi:hypothetical protein